MTDANEDPKPAVAFQEELGVEEGRNWQARRDVSPGERSHWGQVSSFPGVSWLGHPGRGLVGKADCF